MSLENNQEIVDSFPYEKYHSCRLTEPNYPDYAYKKCAEKHKGKCIDHNYGIKSPKHSELQALRYSETIWTANDAGAHCKSRGGSFEPAKKPKEKQSSGEHDMTFNSETKHSDIPAGAFELTWNGAVSCFTDDEKNKVRLTLYDGSVVKHWYWGNLAFDMEGIKLAANRIPILGEHDTQKRVGVSTDATFDGAFILVGELLKNSPTAGEYRRDSIDGFPFQASLRFDPNKSKFEFVKDGETVEVNGNKLTGPGTLFSKTCIMEGSICVFGALKNTKSEMFKNGNADDALLVAESLGDKSVRDLFGKFAERFGDDPAFCIEQFNKGATLEQATAAMVGKLKAERQQLIEQAKLQAKTRIDPAMQEFSDQQQAPKKTQEAESEEIEMLEFVKGDEHLARSALRKLHKAEAENRIQII